MKQSAKKLYHEVLSWDYAERIYSGKYSKHSYHGRYKKVKNWSKLVRNLLKKRMNYDNKCTDI